MTHCTAFHSKLCQQTSIALTLHFSHLLPAQVLAVVDILYLATCVVIQPLNTSKMLGLWHTSYDVLLIQLHVDSYTWFLASVMQTIMIWVVILVTADRYLAICKPLNCHKLRTIQKCRVAVCGVVVLAVLYNIPLLFEHKVVYSLNQCTGSPQARLDLTYLRNDPLYFLVYKTLCHLTFRSLGPLLILIVLNGKLIAALRRLRIRRRSLTRSCTPGDNVTLMLVAVVSVFVVCELPDCCLRLSVTLIDYAAFLYNEEAVRTANVFVNMLHTFNSSVNFLIYCLVGRKFRRILVGICCGTTADRLTQEDDVELRVTTNQSAGNNALYEMC